MNKRIALSLLTIISVLAMVSGATIANYNDTETSYDNTFAAGTLDLKVDGQDDGSTVVSYSVSDMKPGDSVCYTWELKNTGSIDGVPSVEFSVIDNQENGTNEPEDGAEAQPYASSVEGELGEYLKPKSTYSPVGWTCGVGDDMFTNWQTGPKNPWETPGLNGGAGNTYGMGGTVLSKDETVQFSLKLTLEDDLRMWDGTKWVDVDDNIIQSDSAEFDIIFHLDQAP